MHVWSDLPTEQTQEAMLRRWEGEAFNHYAEHIRGWVPGLNGPDLDTISTDFVALIPHTYA